MERLIAFWFSKRYITAAEEFGKHFCSHGLQLLNATPMCENMHRRLEFVQADYFNGRRIKPQYNGHDSKDRLRTKNYWISGVEWDWFYRHRKTENTRVTTVNKD